MTELDYFDISHPPRCFKFEEGQRPQAPGPNLKEGDYLREQINAGLRERGLTALDVVSLQFSDDLGAPLCRVWYLGGEQQDSASLFVGIAALGD